MSEASEIDLTISSIWRQERISCQPRSVLQDFVAGKLPIERADYIRFHILEIGCPFCQASEEDLRMQRSAQSNENGIRERLLEKTADYLKKRGKI